jgi:hypothetical protein
MSNTASEINVMYSFLEPPSESVDAPEISYLGIECHLRQLEAPPSLGERRSIAPSGPSLGSRFFVVGMSIRKVTLTKPFRDHSDP